MQASGVEASHGSSRKRDRIRSLIDSILYRVVLFIGFQRTWYHLCPYCNDDAPTVYDCPVCDGWDFHNRCKKPTRELERAWWSKFKKKLKEDLHIG